MYAEIHIYFIELSSRKKRWWEALSSTGSLSPLQLKDKEKAEKSIIREWRLWRQDISRSRALQLASIFVCLIVTCDSYGRNAMLISLRVLIFLAARDLQISLNSSSGHTGIECKHECILIISMCLFVNHMWKAQIGLDRLDERITLYSYRSVWYPRDPRD